MIKETVKNIIACPKCKGNLSIDEEARKMMCKKCKIEFEIKDNIPVLILD